MYAIIKLLVNVERFAGPNIHSFSPMKFFARTLSWYPGQQYLLFNYSYIFTRKTFVLLLKSMKTMKVKYIARYIAISIASLN